MRSETATQFGHRRGKEYRHLALQATETMTDEYGCIRRRCCRIQLDEGLAYLVQRDAGQQAVTQ